MNDIASKPESAEASPLLSEVTWSRCDALLAWSSGDCTDARRMFMQLAEAEPERHLRNKFPTHSMPCIDWAYGNYSGWRIHLRLGVDHQRDEFQLSTSTRGVESTLVRLRRATDALPDRAQSSLTVHLSLSCDSADAPVLRWFNARGPDRAVTQRHDYALEAKAQGALLRVSGEVDRTGSAPHLGLDIEVSSHGQGSPSTGQKLFAVLHDVLSADRFDRLIG